MREIDVKRLIDNIYEVAKKKKIRIGDLELAVGVSQGYFSRFRTREEKVPVPGIEVIAAVAKELDTTVDVLLWCDYNATAESDRYICSFLKKLIEDSEKLDLIWEADTEAAIENLMRAGPAQAGHPLFRTVFDAGKSRLVYASAFHEYESAERITAAGPIYHTVINGGKNELYLSRISCGEEGKYCSCEYELYLLEKQKAIVPPAFGFAGERQKKPVCHSAPDVPDETGSYLKSLYGIAGRTVAHIRLDPDVKNAISLFMDGN